MIDVIAGHAYTANSPRSYAAMFHLGGAVARVPLGATAYAGREAQHNIVIEGVWLRDGPGELAAAETSWVRGFFAALEPHRAAGVYVNFFDADEGTARVREAYGGEL